MKSLLSKLNKTLIINSILLPVVLAFGYLIFNKHFPSIQKIYAMGGNFYCSNYTPSCNPTTQNYYCNIGTSCNNNTDNIVYGSTCNIGGVNKPGTTVCASCYGKDQYTCVVGLPLPLSVTNGENGWYGGIDSNVYCTPHDTFNVQKAGTYTYNSCSCPSAYTNGSKSCGVCKQPNAPSSVWPTIPLSVQNYNVANMLQDENGNCGVAQIDVGGECGVANSFTRACSPNVFTPPSPAKISSCSTNTVTTTFNWSYNINFQDLTTYTSPKNSVNISHSLPNSLEIYATDNTNTYGLTNPSSNATITVSGLNASLNTTATNGTCTTSSVTTSCTSNSGTTFTSLSPFVITCSNGSCIGDPSPPNYPFNQVGSIKITLNYVNASDNYNIYLTPVTNGAAGGIIKGSVEQANINHCLPPSTVTESGNVTCHQSAIPSNTVHPNGVQMDFTQINGNPASPLIHPQYTDASGHYSSGNIILDSTTTGINVSVDQTGANPPNILPASWSINSTSQTIPASNINGTANFDYTGSSFPTAPSVQVSSAQVCSDKQIQWQWNLSYLSDQALLPWTDYRFRIIDITKGEVFNTIPPVPWHDTTNLPTGYSVSLGYANNNYFMTLVQNLYTTGNNLHQANFGHTFQIEVRPVDSSSNNQACTPDGPISVPVTYNSGCPVVPTISGKLSCQPLPSTPGGPTPTLIPMWGNLVKLTDNTSGNIYNNIPDFTSGNYSITPPSPVSNGTVSPVDSANSYPVSYIGVDGSGNPYPSLSPAQYYPQTQSVASGLPTTGLNFTFQGDRFDTPIVINSPVTTCGSSSSIEWTWAATADHNYTPVNVNKWQDYDFRVTENDPTTAGNPQVSDTGWVNVNNNYLSNFTVSSGNPFTLLETNINSSHVYNLSVRATDSSDYYGCTPAGNSTTSAPASCKPIYTGNEICIPFNQSINNKITLSPVSGTVDLNLGSIDSATCSASTSNLTNSGNWSITVPAPTPIAPGQSINLQFNPASSNSGIDPFYTVESSQVCGAGNTLSCGASGLSSSPSPASACIASAGSQSSNMFTYKGVQFPAPTKVTCTSSNNLTCTWPQISENGIAVTTYLFQVLDSNNIPVQNFTEVSCNTVSPGIPVICSATYSFSQNQCGVSNVLYKMNVKAYDSLDATIGKVGCNTYLTGQGSANVTFTPANGGTAYCGVECVNRPYTAPYCTSVQACPVSPSDPNCYPGNGNLGSAYQDCAQNCHSASCNPLTGTYSPIEIKGGIVAKSIHLDRDLGLQNNLCYPAEQIHYDTKYINIFKNVITQYLTNFKELGF